MKAMKISRPKPITMDRLLTTTAKEARYTRGLAHEVFAKFTVEADIHGRGVVLKSSRPRSKQGQSLAQIRDDISHIRVYLQALLYQRKI